MLDRLRRRLTLQESAVAAEAIRSDLIDIDEAGIRSDGTVPIKLITPGWGSSGYYPAATLERDCAEAFPAGTQMFWDHPTVSESSERPERSLRDLAGVLATPARWVAEHPSGAGAYAEAKVFAQYQPILAEMAPHIGVSIRALGEQHIGEADGKRGRIIDRITEGRSVDFVTKAGRGGEVLALLESARHIDESLYNDDLRDRLRTALIDRYGEGQDRWCYVRDFNAETVVFETYGDAVDNPGTFQIAYMVDADDNVSLDPGEPIEVKVTTTYTPVSATTTPVTESQEDPMTPEEIQEAVAVAVDAKLAPLTEANAELTTKLTEATAKIERQETGTFLRETETLVRSKLAAAKLPALVQTKIVEALTAHPATAEDGTLDVAALDEALKVQVTEWSNELGLGKVAGLGDSTTEVTEAQTDERLTAAFGRLGLSESAAKLAAAGRR